MQKNLGALSIKHVIVGIVSHEVFLNDVQDNSHTWCSSFTTLHSNQGREYEKLLISTQN